MPCDFARRRSGKTRLDGRAPQHYLDDKLVVGLEPLRLIEEENGIQVESVELFQGVVVDRIFAS
eukprot:scaffold3664_cov407-Prasinococcus_capsulatus_cf.AAC.8